MSVIGTLGTCFCSSFLGCGFLTTNLARLLEYSAELSFIMPTISLAISMLPSITGSFAREDCWSSLSGLPCLNSSSKRSSLVRRLSILRIRLSRVDAIFMNSCSPISKHWFTSGGMFSVSELHILITLPRVGWVLCLLGGWREKSNYREQWRTQHFVMRGIKRLFYDDDNDNLSLDNLKHWNYCVYLGQYPCTIKNISEGGHGPFAPPIVYATDRERERERLSSCSQLYICYQGPRIPPLYLIKYIIRLISICREFPSGNYKCSRWNFVDLRKVSK